MQEMTINFDYLSFTIPLEVEENKYVKYESECLSLCEALAGKMGFSTDEIFRQERTANGYKYTWNIGEFIFFRGYGPQNVAGYYTCQIELTGSACRELEENGFCTVLELLIYAFEKYQANFTRIDVAIDDFKGKYANIQKIENKLIAEHYTTSFRSKYSRSGNDENGFSLYFGSKKSTQMLVIYDKLAERKRKSALVLTDFWTRYEMRFMGEKAKTLAVKIFLDNGLDIEKTAFGLLREMLDIKDTNNYNQDNQNKASTVDWWKDFLNDTAKLKLNEYAPKAKSTIASKDIWFGDKLKKMLASLMLTYDNDFINRIYAICLEGYEKLTNKDRFIIDKARKERKKEAWTDEALSTFLKQIKEVVNPEDNDFLSQYDIESLKILEAIEKDNFNKK